MKRSISTETEKLNVSTETDSLIINTPYRMSNHQTESLSASSIMSEDVARQINAVTDSLTQQMARLFELMRELKQEKANRSHGETHS